jgi:hypothetical protein
MRGRLAGESPDVPEKLTFPYMGTWSNSRPVASKVLVEEGIVWRVEVEPLPIHRA